MTNPIKVGSAIFGGEGLLPIIAGLCIIENLEHTLNTAKVLQAICEKCDFPLIFKASFDKANRSSADSYRGPGLEKGLEILNEVKLETGLPVLISHSESVFLPPVAINPSGLIANSVPM